jgi:ferredoxin
MCVTVCPSGALAFAPRREIERLRRERPIDRFEFGGDVVRTKVQLMVPAVEEELDVAALMAGESRV